MGRANAAHITCTVVVFSAILFYLFYFNFLADSKVHYRTCINEAQFGRKPSKVLLGGFL
jgi:hypothetical protein